MANPQNKNVLIEEMQDAHDLLSKAVASLTEEDLLCPKTWGDWSFKDMLAHITDWEGRIFSWYLAGLRGETPVTPDPDFDWEHIDDLNHAFYLKHRDDPLDEVLEGFEQSWLETLHIVRGMPVEHLFKMGQFAWLKEYLWVDVMYGSTTHHYRDHLKDVQAWLDQQRDSK